MISPLAYIHQDTVLGNNVKIEPFAVIHEDVRIGENSHIMSNAVIMPGTTIGKGCTIFPGAVIGAVPQDLKFGPYWTPTGMSFQTPKHFLLPGLMSILYFLSLGLC